MVMKRSIRATLLAIATAALLAAPAFAAPRQYGTMTFTSTTPRTPTGTSLHVFFQNPDDPTAKPYTVQNMVIHSPAGTQTDTTDFPQCHATDAELLTIGPPACPIDSYLGGGQAKSDQGPNSPQRYSWSDISDFNNQDEVVGVAVNEDIALIKNVDRSKYDYRNGTLTSTFPLFPAVPEPPTMEPYTPIAELQIHFPAHVDVLGHAYSATPSTCPPERHWTFVIDFIYRDGVTQSITSESPCSGPAGSPDGQPRALR